MSAPAPVRAATAAIATASRVQAGALLQRKCACGAAKSPLSNTCDECKSPALQRKLAIGSSDDPLEAEADGIAEQALNRNMSGGIAQSPLSIRRVASQSAAGNAGTAPASVQRALASGGSPLEAGLRRDMEQRFGHDFSRVRVHTGPVAEQSAQDVSAHAYTVGHSIVFDAGRFAPGTATGRRLLAHELTHVVQQSAASRAAAPIQREVNPKRIASKEAVLEKIKRIVDATGTGKDPALANLSRLGKLGIGFNPGASKEEKDNAFVYTCRCGWIDMGHFFISAAAAYGVGYQRRRLELRVGGKPHTIDELLAGGSNKLGPLLDVLLKTVPDKQGENALASVRKLLQSGEPRDIALVFGYWMEFVQQVAKLIADPGRSLPEGFKEQMSGVLDEYQRIFKSIAPQAVQDTIEGSARSAFTIEDLPSDCYGAALGQDVWKQTDGAKRDLPPIHGLMETFLSDCGAVFPEAGSKTRCEMMAETTPGSCRMENGKDVWPADLGEPARHGSTQARLLNSARPLCGEPSTVKPCRSATGDAGAPLPAAVVDVSKKDGVTLALNDDFSIHQPRERGYFGLDKSVPGRPERIDPKTPLVLSGTSFLRVTPRLNVIGYSTLSGVPGIGDIDAAAHFDPGLGRYGAGGSLGFRGRFDVQTRGILQLHVQGKADIDLSDLLHGLAGPELEDLKAVFKSDEFAQLAKQLLSGDIKIGQLVRETRKLLKAKFPQGFKGIVSTVIWRLENMEALALSTSLDAQGSVTIGGVPISGFVLHKGFGLQPLLGLEGGVVLSELAKGRTIVGAKGWLYGQDILQAQFTAGVDPLGRKFVAEIHATNKTLTGNKLSLDLQYQLNPAGDQQFLVLFGGEFNAFGSKPAGSR
ncbi:MAG TPA: DUF4157 domain-containing protein [Burkholderiales bacterium]|nr:DUF4157 domain-containing protein [Burkholderiales bacterium]